MGNAETCYLPLKLKLVLPVFCFAFVYFWLVFLIFGLQVTVFCISQFAFVLLGFSDFDGKWRNFPVSLSVFITDLRKATANDGKPSVK